MKQNIDASGIPVEWSVSWGVASKAAIPLSCPTRTFTADDASDFCINRCHDFRGFAPDADLVIFAS